MALELGKLDIVLKSKIQSHEIPGQGTMWLLPLMRRGIYCIWLTDYDYMINKLSGIIQDIEPASQYHSVFTVIDSRNIKSSALG